MPPLPISLCADRSGFTLSAACCKMHVGAYIAHLRQLWKQRFPSTSPLRTAERRVDHSSARYWHINVLSVALCDLAEFQKPFPESSSRNWVFPVERRAPLWATRDFLSLLIVFFSGWAQALYDSNRAVLIFKIRWCGQTSLKQREKYTKHQS